MVQGRTGLGRAQTVGVGGGRPGLGRWTLCLWGTQAHVPLHVGSSCGMDCCAPRVLLAGAGNHLWMRPASVALVTSLSHLHTPRLLISVGWCHLVPRWGCISRLQPLEGRLHASLAAVYLAWWGFQFGWGWSWECMVWGAVCVHLCGLCHVFAAA